MSMIKRYLEDVSCRPQGWASAKETIDALIEMCGNWESQ